MRRHTNLEEPGLVTKVQRGVYSRLWGKLSDGDDGSLHKHSIPAAQCCDSDVSQHQGTSSVCLHWLSGSFEQDADPGNVKTRDFQSLEGKTRLSEEGSKRQKRGMADESHGLLHKKGPDSIASPLTNPQCVLLNMFAN